MDIEYILKKIHDEDDESMVLYADVAPKNPGIAKVFKVKTNEENKQITVERRFAIIDADTGEIFDDANGYGFRSPEKAWRSFRYRRHSSEERMEYDYAIRHAESWIHSHKRLSNKIIKSILDTVKSGNKYSDEDFKRDLGEYAESVDFELLHFKRVTGADDVRVPPPPTSPHLYDDYGEIDER